MKHPSTLNQIWIGSELPEREKAWIATIKARCESLGIVYHLWDENELLGCFPAEEIWNLANTMEQSVRRSVLLADYFRMIVLNPGEAYLDTDFICHHAPEINFQGSSVLSMGEYWNSQKEATGFIGVQYKCQLLDLLKEAWRNHVADLDKDCLNNLLDAYGPKFFRETVQRLGIKPIIVPRSQVTHIQWKNKGALIHQGAGAWV